MIKTYNPTTPTLRSRKSLVKDVDNVRPQKSLSKGQRGSVGKSWGTISSRHRQHGSRKLYRTVDFKRDKYGITAVVETIEHDPNRGPNIALLSYADGEKRYMLAPEGLAKGTVVSSGPTAEPIVGNCLPLENIPLGMQVHNIELNPGSGGVLIRGAGGYALLLAKEGNYVSVKLPSGEVKRIQGKCYATIGSLSNMDLRNTRLGKAGRMRYLGRRPHVRGVSMADPHHDHPHAGKYRSSGIGMPSPKSPWGWKTKGVKSRRRTHTNYTIVKSRHTK